MSKPKLDIRRDDQGAVDDIVAEGAYVHIERMDEDEIWATIAIRGGPGVTLTFASIRGRVTLTAEAK